ncbi:MAG: RagB/SusD family nutrient uptake outer membrane protein [Ferruginibacter sp.]
MNKAKYIFFMAAIVMVASCNKLDEKALSQNSPDEFFTSQTDVAAALAGMYRPLQQCCGGPEQAGNFILNAVSDEGIITHPNWGSLDPITYTPSSIAEFSDLYNSTYRSIAGSNLVIDNEAKITALDNTSGKSYTKQVLGEAKFLRAYNYFALVQMFGGVPLRITQAKRADEVDIERSTEAQVYEQIIKDFTDAEAGLPTTNPAGKPTKWAASAYLAKVYLTMKDYPKALAKAKEVVANGPYSLIPKFADVFDVDKKNNAEVIFAIQYIRVEGQGMRMEYLVTGPNDKYATNGNTGWGLVLIQDGFYNKYSPADDRLKTTFTNPAPGQTTYYSGKWKDLQGVSADGHGNDFILYRYADLVLVLAEAENEVNGPSQLAYTNLNAVRERAKLTDLSGLTKDQFRDAVINERNLELSFEELRWFDLKRTGKLKDVIIASGRNWNDRYLLFPIPQSEVDASNGKIKQNPGY